ncbi:MAG: hypothetical protein II655_12655 [Thermoguttaceae bacterium]|nr:hypothetical protein [Thermoguttaceae bacterium]
MGKMNKITIAASGVVLALVCGASLFTDVAMAQTQQLNTLKNARQYTVYRGKNNITGDRNFLEPTQAPVISDLDVDSNYIYVGTDDRYVYRLDMNNVDLLPERIFEIADSWIRAIEISPDGGTMAVLSQNGELKIRNLNTNDWIDISEGGIDSKMKGAHALVYSPDGKQIAVTCNKGQGNGAALNSSVYIYSIENSASKDIRKFVVRLDQILPAPMGSRTALAFSNSGEMLAVGGNDGTFVLYDVKNRPARVIESLKFNQKSSRRVRAFAFNKSDTLLAVGGDKDEIELWNIGNLDNISLVNGLTLPPQSQGNNSDGVIRPSRNNGNNSAGKVFALNFCESENYLVSGDSLNRVLLWDVATQTLLADGKGHRGTVTCLKYLAEDPLDPIGSKSPCIFSGSFDTTVIKWKFE